jgi:hypothetical protein
MEKEMEELYIEGVATHGGPESGVGSREAVGEARTGVRAGWAMEPRNRHFGVPTSCKETEGDIGGSASASCRPDPARSETLSMHGISMRENREIPGLPAGLITGGPLREGKSRSLR